MARVRVKYKNEFVEGEELAFEPLKESWNEYRCEDGSYVRMKLVVSKIVKLDVVNEQGEPVYQVASANVLAATPPARDRQ
jgi:hypothetical protein